MKNIRGYQSQVRTAGPFTLKLRLSSVDSRKLTELEVGRMTMREEMRSWLTETGLTH